MSRFGALSWRTLVAVTALVIVSPTIAVAADPPPVEGSIPSITGDAEVGITLEVAEGPWSPDPVDFDYQWLRDGVDIAGATLDSYQLGQADAGARMSVDVTGSSAGRTDRTETSAETLIVQGGTLTTALPTISGSAVVGGELTASSGPWSPGAVDLSFQWNRDGVAIDGAIGSVYLLTDDEANAVISVTATGTRDGFVAASTTSLGTEPVSVAPAARRLDGGDVSGDPPIVTGAFTVGSTLTATTDDWLPADLTLDYQWLRGGVAISGADEQTYTLIPADSYTYISVRVTGSYEGYGSHTETSVAKRVQKYFVATPTPTISGTGVVGNVLTAIPGSWDPSSAKLYFQWRRDGVDIEGADKATYQLTSDDAGTQITVAVEGRKTSYSPVTKVSANKAIQSLLTATPVPTISGVLSVGSTLAAEPGTWEPNPVTLKYKWLRNGVAISGATLDTYTLTPADAFQLISVSVTGSKSGHTSVTKTSAEKRIPHIFTTTPKPVISGTLRVGSTLTAVPGTWAPSSAVLYYQWRRDGVPIAEPSKTATTYKLTSADAGTRISLLVSGRKTGYTTVDMLSSSKLIEKQLTLTPTPTFTGIDEVGEVFYSTAGTWDEGVTLTYQWKRDGVAIAGATKANYRLAKADARTTITVTVTGTLAGYTTISMTSAGDKVKGVFITKPVTVWGDMTPGSTLTLMGGEESQWTPGGTYAWYRWYKDGVEIEGAYYHWYQVQESDLGAIISVKLMVSQSGYSLGERLTVLGEVVLPVPPQKNTFGLVGYGGDPEGAPFQHGRFATSGGDQCEWARFNYDGEVIASGSGPGQWIVTIAVGDYAFYSYGCGNWKNIQDLTFRKKPLPNIGTFATHFEFLPGTWQSSGGDSSCHWTIMWGFGHDNYWEKGGGAGVQTVHIAAKMDGLDTYNCGTWTRIGD
jgi:hypothetical protein